MTDTPSPAPAVTVERLIECCRSWEPEAHVLCDVRAGDAAEALEYAASRLRDVEADREEAKRLAEMTVDILGDPRSRRSGAALIRVYQAAMTLLRRLAAHSPPHRCPLTTN